MNVPQHNFTNNRRGGNQNITGARNVRHPAHRGNTSNHKSLDCNKQGLTENGLNQNGYGPTALSVRAMDPSGLEGGSVELDNDQPHEPRRRDRNSRNRRTRNCRGEIVQNKNSFEFFLREIVDSDTGIPNARVRHCARNPVRTRLTTVSASC